MSNCQRISEYLSGYLDGELTQQDRQRIEIHLESCHECRQSLEELRNLSTAVGNLKFEKLSANDWSEMMNDITVKTSRGIGWLLLIVGIVLVVGYAIYSFAVDDSVEALVKTGVFGIMIGALFLLISVARQRWLARKTDKYEDVQI